MTAADYTDKPLLDLACPTCSHLRERHRELLDDVLVFPSILFSAPSTERRYRDGKYRVIGCGHVKSCFGAWNTLEAAQQAIRECFAEMRAERTGAEIAQSEPFSETIQRETGGAEMRRNPYGHTMQEQSRAAGETPGDGEAQPGETPGEARGLHATLSGVETGEAEAPLCEVGGNIWANHDLGIDGKCSRCSWEYPKLKL